MRSQHASGRVFGPAVSNGDRRRNIPVVLVPVKAFSSAICVLMTSCFFVPVDSDVRVTI